MATKQQAIALFCRFYPESHTTLKSTDKEEKKELSPDEKTIAIHSLAEKFALDVPEHEFSTAELQGYLLSCKKEPEMAVEGVSDWVEQERRDRKDREDREAERKAKRDANQLQGSLARLGIVTPNTATAAVGQQPLGSVLEPTVITTTSTPVIPNFNLTAIQEDAARHVTQRLQAAGVVLDNTTTSTPIIPNPTAFEDDEAQAEAQRQLGVPFDNIDEGPSRHKPIVNGATNGTTDNEPITPPRILLNSD